MGVRRPDAIGGDADLGAGFPHAAWLYARRVDAGTAQSRLRSLLEAGIALTSELSLDAVLQRVLEAAAELTGARYAALGVIDTSGTELERFLVHGIDAETHSAIGELPRGRGILGVLIRDATALRLADLGNDRARSGSRLTTLRCAPSSVCRSCCAESRTGTST